MDREAFLSRVSRGVLAADLPPPPAVPPDLPPLGSRDLVDLFRSRAQSVNVVVHGPVARHSVPRSVVGIAAGHEVSRFATWEDLPAPGVAAALSAEGYERVDEEPDRSDGFPHTPISTVDLGVTGSSFALAESGSVVLRHHSGRSRLVSALPEIHVALVRVDTITRSLADWAHDEPDAVAGTANLVIVTGPSRTADIEQNLSLGVHGPKHLHVVLMK